MFMKNYYEAVKKISLVYLNDLAHFGTQCFIVSCCYIYVMAPRGSVNTLLASQLQQYEYLSIKLMNIYSHFFRINKPHTEVLALLRISK